MATMQGYISGQETPLDELPSWKRELILRKRANARIHGGLGVPSPTQPMAGRGRGSLSGQSLPAPSSLSGLHQTVTRSLSGSSPSHPHPPLHANNTAVSSRLDGARGTVSGGDGTRSQKYAVTGDVSSASVDSNMHHKGLNDEGPRVTSPTCSSVSDSYGAEDEELCYGPGIVSKLKNRYLSLAMRESRCRPSLRRFSSLEDLLDTEPREAWQERGSSGAKPRSAQESAVNHRREVMRRARSVDSLSSRLSEDRAPGLPKSKSASSRLQSSLCALGKDDVIIIETSRPVTLEQKAINGADRTVDAGEPPPLTRKLSSSSLAEEEDMPPPDTVRQVKKIFEPVGNRALRGTAARVAVHKAAQSSKSNGVALASKPALKAKPAVVPPRKVTPPPAAATHPFTIEEAKSSLKKVAQVTRPSPRTTLSVRATTLNGDATASTNSGQDIANTARARPGLTPVTASVTAPLVNGDPGLRQAEGESLSALVVEEGVRRVSDIAVSNIRKESHSQEFNFTSQPANSHGAKPATPKPSSPTPTPLPPSPVASHRVPAHTPFSAKGERAQEESERVHQENLKNKEKSRPQTCTVESSQTTLRPATKVETPIQTKVDYNKPLPKVEFVKAPPQVEPYKPSPKKVESKSEVVTAVKTEPVKSSPSPSNELQRSSGKGSLVEAFNTTNKQPTTTIGGSPGSTPLTTKTASHRDRWHQQENTTLVFNFTSSKKDTPDYIENDGIDLSKRRPEVRLASR